jgi:hypothetical protein
VKRFVLLAALAACGGSMGPSSPAADGVKRYVHALRSNDAHEAYDLLSSDVRKQVSFEQFAIEWKQTQAERTYQADQLEKGLGGNPNVGERALLSFSDGKLVQLERDGDRWQLQSELVSRSHAKRPRDAIRMLADAMAARDIGSFVRALSERRRQGIGKQVESIVSSIGKHINDKLDEYSNRAEMHWDENGVRYRIVLVKEDDEWRVDDIYIRATPKNDEGDKTEGIEGAVQDDL